MRAGASVLRENVGTLVSAPFFAIALPRCSPREMSLVSEPGSDESGKKDVIDV